MPRCVESVAKPTDVILVAGCDAEEKEGVATRRGSAVAFSIIRRAGSPVLRSLSRLHPAARSVGCTPPSLRQDANTVRAVQKQEKGGEEKSGKAEEKSFSFVTPAPPAERPARIKAGV